MAVKFKGIWHIFIQSSSQNLHHVICRAAASRAILSSIQHKHFSSQWKNRKITDFTNGYWFWRNCKTFGLDSLTLCGASCHMSTKEEQESEVQFKESSKCLIFDQTDILISQTTFKDAKALAKKNKARLVYLNKNKDGISCFKLQPLTISQLPPPPKLQIEQRLPTHKKDSNEDPTKLFKIKSSINDHDLNIKITKMKTLLTKGSPVKIIIQHRVSEVETIKLELSKKLTEELTNVSKIRQDTSNKGTTKFTLMPLDQQKTNGEKIMKW